MRAVSCDIRSVFAASASVALRVNCSRSRISAAVRSKIRTSARMSADDSRSARVIKTAAVACGIRRVRTLPRASGKTWTTDGRSCRTVAKARRWNCDRCSTNSIRRRDERTGASPRAHEPSHYRRAELFISESPLLDRCEGDLSHARTRHRCGPGTPVIGGGAECGQDKLPTIEARRDSSIQLPSGSRIIEIRATSPSVTGAKPSRTPLLRRSAWSRSISPICSVM